MNCQYTKAMPEALRDIAVLPRPPHRPPTAESVHLHLQKAGTCIHACSDVHLFIPKWRVKHPNNHLLLQFPAAPLRSHREAKPFLHRHASNGPLAAPVQCWRAHNDSPLLARATPWRLLWAIREGQPLFRVAFDVSLPALWPQAERRRPRKTLRRRAIVTGVGF